MVIPLKVAGLPPFHQFRNKNLFPRKRKWNQLLDSTSLFVVGRKIVLKYLKDNKLAKKPQKGKNSTKQTFTLYKFSPESNVKHQNNTSESIQKYYLILFCIITVIITFLLKMYTKYYFLKSERAHEKVLAGTFWHFWHFLIPSHCLAWTWPRQIEARCKKC